jgi:hypothetical protein
MTTNDIKTRKPGLDKPDPDMTGKPEADTYESRVQELAASARDLASQIEDGSARIVDRMPEAVESVRSSAMDAARTVEAMPESTRRILATLSLGLGAGLYLAGAPRLLTLIALAPALVVGGTWLARDPQRPVVH